MNLNDIAILTLLRPQGFRKCSSEDFLICFYKNNIIQTSFDPISIALVVQEIIFGSQVTQSSRSDIWLKFSYKHKMQNVGFVYELYMLLIHKKYLASFSNHIFLFWHGFLKAHWVKLFLLITQKSHFSSFLMVLIKRLYSPFALQKRD